MTAGSSVAGFSMENVDGESVSAESERGGFDLGECPGENMPSDMSDDDEGESPKRKCTVTVKNGPESISNVQSKVNRFISEGHKAKIIVRNAMKEGGKHKGTVGEQLKGAPEIIK